MTLASVAAPTPSLAAIERTMRDLDAVGVGWPATPGEEARRAYVVERLESLGYEVERQTFPFLAYPLDARSSCVSSLLGEIPTHPVQYTRSARVEGQLVYVGQGRDDDFTALDLAGIDLSGKIGMARTSIPFAVFGELVRRGAAGVAVHADTHDELIPHFTGRGFPPPLSPPWKGAYAEIPGVIVPKGRGDELLTAHAGGVGTVAIEHAVDYFEATTQNVVAKLRGETDEFVVVAAHYDTQAAGGPSDNDNGLAVLLELARLFRETRPKLGIRFVAVACEEAIMWGSHAYAQRHKDELQLSCRAMINWDSPSSAYAMKRACWGSHELRPLAAAAAAATGWSIETWQDAREFFLTDDAPFHGIGIPTLWFWEHPPIHPYYHSTGDTIDKIDFEKLRHVTEIGAWVLAALIDGVEV